LAHTIGISVSYIIKIENEKLHFGDYPAEAIMRGIKKTEYRSVPTKIRGRIMIYDDQGRYSADEKSEMMDNSGITDWLVRDTQHFRRCPAQVAIECRAVGLPTQHNTS
jgi:hypothetical protein